MDLPVPGGFVFLEIDTLHLRGFRKLSKQSKEQKKRPRTLKELDKKMKDLGFVDRTKENKDRAWVIIPKGPRVKGDSDSV